jgi:hypothetical protein
MNITQTTVTTTKFEDYLVVEFSSPFEKVPSVSCWLTDPSGDDQVHIRDLDERGFRLDLYVTEAPDVPRGIGWRAYKTR